jgi:YgiT-type zinc finger domain-containing protein
VIGANHLGDLGLIEGERYVCEACGADEYEPSVTESHFNRVGGGTIRVRGRFCSDCRDSLTSGVHRLMDSLRSD